MKFEFKTDGSEYELADNKWYAVTQDNEIVMLVDTDCKVSDEILRIHWSDGDYRSKNGENGQTILDYCNNIANTYLENIKYAIEPRTVTAGIGKLENAYMWLMSKDEFINNKTIGGKIVENSHSSIWTRTFFGNNYNVCFAWKISNCIGQVSTYNVNNFIKVAPSFYLKKSEIDYITKDNKIILKPCTNRLDATEKLNNVYEYVEEYKAKYLYRERNKTFKGGNISKMIMIQEMIGMCDHILCLIDKERWFEN